MSIKFDMLDSWQDVYFDDESAEVVISSLRLGDDHEGYTAHLYSFPSFQY